MSKRLYESAHTIVYDPVSSNRNATRASLHSLGFRRVDVATDLKNLETRLSEHAPDLVFIEVAGAEAECCRLIQSVRQGKLGEDPFIVLMVTTWRRDGTVVAQLLNSGADDVVARPISTAVLGDRIRLQVESRKGFVVTSAYIGPDRRRGARSSSVECVDVPNPLQIKTLEGLSFDEAVARVAQERARGKQVLNAEKLRRDAIQLCAQWRLIEQRSPSAGDYLDILGRMAKLVEEIQYRAVAPAYASAREWCQSVTNSVLAIGNMADQAVSAQRDIEGDFGPALRLLGHATFNLGQMLAPNEVPSTQLTELDDSLARMKERQAAESQAAA
jgi:DNA-binding response OmpR family regulator